MASTTVPPDAAPAATTTTVGVADRTTIAWDIEEHEFLAASAREWSAFPMQARFVHVDSGRELEIDAYWAGGTTWRVRFAPPLTGRWNWTTESDDPGLDGHRGSLDAVEPGTADIEANQNRRGHLRVATDQRYLTYADGTPFLWLGDTGWKLNSLRAGLGGGDGDAPFYAYVGDRLEKRFSVIQMQFLAVGDENEGGLPFLSNVEDNGDFTDLNADHMEFLDVRIDTLASEGFAIAAHPMWFGGNGDVTNVRRPMRRW